MAMDGISDIIEKVKGAFRAPTPEEDRSAGRQLLPARGNVPISQQFGQMIDEAAWTDKVGMDPGEDKASYAEEVDTAEMGKLPGRKVGKEPPVLNYSEFNMKASPSASAWIAKKSPKGTQEVKVVPGSRGGFDVTVNGEIVSGVESEGYAKTIASSWLKGLREAGLPARFKK